MSPTDYKKPKRIIEYILFLGFFHIIKIVPLRWGNWVGKKLCLLAYHLVQKRRDLTIKNIREAKQRGFMKNTPDAEVLSRQVWEHLGVTGSEFLYYYSHNFSKIRKHVSLQGEENLKTILAKNKGAIMATAHIGNWELFGIYLSLMGYQLSPLVKNQENPVIDKIIQDKRRSAGMKVIPRTGFLRPIVEALKRQEIVPFLMDQHDQSGVEVDFFGRLACIPRGAAEFALRTDTPIFLTYIHRLDKFHHRIVITPEIELERTGDYQTDLKNAVTKLANAIQNAIEKEPAQWLWMHSLWK